MTTKPISFATFPQKVYTMLKKCGRFDFEDIVSWQPHGKSFKIHSTELFVEKVLPLFFRQTKIKSFSRQLYNYGFRRTVKGEDAGCYHHKHFLKGNEQLLREIYRIKSQSKVAISNSSDSNRNKNIFIGIQRDCLLNDDSDNDYHRSDNGSFMHDNDDFDRKAMSQDKNQAGCITRVSFGKGDVIYEKFSYHGEKCLNINNKENSPNKKEIALFEKKAKRKSSIYMDTFEDDVYFGLVIESLSMMQS